MRFPPFQFSHYGLHVFRIEPMRDFYCSLFGLRQTDESVLRTKARIVFLSRNSTEHHQVVLIEGRTAPPDARLLNQISFRIGTLAELRAAHAMIATRTDVSDIQPVNHGTAFSIYFRDPEGNRLEVFVDSPFYVAQAIVGPLDLSLTDAEILEETCARHSSDPTFRSADDWKKRFRLELAQDDLAVDHVVGAPPLKMESTA